MKTFKNIFLKTTFLALTILSVATSCSKDDDQPAPTPEPEVVLPTSDVYGLAITNGSTLPPFYYKNSTKTNIVVGANEQATTTSIYVTGEDIYVTGNITTTTGGLQFQQACYWKNNVRVNVSHSISSAGGNQAIIEAITVVGNEVYAVGQIATTVGSASRIVLWRNGVSSFVSAPSVSVYYYAKTISVFGNDVYVSGNGFVRDESTAAFWKNGVITTLSASLSEVETVIANASGVHAVFIEFGLSFGGSIKYWKDGTVSNISSPLARMGKMTIKGNDVYITGAERTTSTAEDKACFWKNGIKTELANGNNKIAGDIKFGINNDMFIAQKAKVFGTLTFWKNNVAASLGNSTDVFYSFDINNK